MKYVVKQLWNALPKIHKYWGFSGRLDKDGVFFDSASMKITVLNWDRGQLPMCHVPEINDGERQWEQRDFFMQVSRTYGQRLINGY